LKEVLLPNQMAADGSFPQELARTKPYGYSMFNLDVMTALAVVCSTPQENLMTWSLPTVANLVKGVAWLAPLIADKALWLKTARHDVTRQKKSEPATSETVKPDVMYWDGLARAPAVPDLRRARRRQRKRGSRPGKNSMPSRAWTRLSATIRSDSPVFMDAVNKSSAGLGPAGASRRLALLGAARLRARFARTRASSDRRRQPQPSPPPPSFPRSPTHSAAGQKLFVAPLLDLSRPQREGGKGPTLAQPSLPPRDGRRPPPEDHQVGPAGHRDAGVATLSGSDQNGRGFCPFARRRPPEAVVGDASRGATALRHEGACAQCHTLNGRGGAIGAGSGGIGFRRSPAFLRRALTEPAAEVPLSFSAWALGT